MTIQKLPSGFWHVRFGPQRFVQWAEGATPCPDDTFGFFTEDKEDAARTGSPSGRGKEPDNEPTANQEHQKQRAVAIPEHMIVTVLRYFNDQILSRAASYGQSWKTSSWKPIFRLMKGIPRLCLPG